nr:MAG: hypothetical protein DIU78_03210 [Pseudomonadota bacterium]
MERPDDRRNPPTGTPAESLDRALGTGDGSADSIELVTLFTPTGKRSATALAFDPLRDGELWVTLRRFPTEAPCTTTVQTGCAALVGNVALLQDATSDAPVVTMKEDGNAWHFMRRPTSIAFGTNGNLATCGEARTANYEDQPTNYNGPTLWSSDPAIFGVPPEPGQNGTHLDMLHETPYCMGIAHERDNVYWTFNGELGAIDRYDFNEPHQIGGEDHSDGELFRYVEGEVKREPEIPSHLAYDKERDVLYVADTGNGRIARLDAKAGEEAEPLVTNEHIHKAVRMTGVTLEDFVPPGTLELPSGLVFHHGHLYVTDNATSRIHAFDREGALVRTLDTGLPPGSLSGITIGPDGRTYITDRLTGQVYRIEPL